MTQTDLSASLTAGTDPAASVAVSNAPLPEVDPEIAAVLDAELGRQRGTLEMIASENFAPRAVLEAQGSVLTNKYAEGYPGRRYYGGCEHVDVAENLARDRARALFGAEHVNVQPHSGAQANAAVMHALIRPGDTILGLELAHGGHLTHGMKINFTGRLYDVAAYGVSSGRTSSTWTPCAGSPWSASPSSSSPAGPRTRATSTSPRSARSPTRSARCSWSTWRTSPAWSPPGCTRPRCRTPTSSPPPCTRRSAARAPAPSSAAPSTRRRSTPRCSRASRAVRSCTPSRPRRSRSRSRPAPSSRPARNAPSRAPGSSPTGSSAPTCATPGCRCSPAAPTCTWSWSTCATAKLDGQQAEDRLHEAGITVNRNAVPFDPRPPMVTSGLRIGTPALATRGFGTEQFTEVADIIAAALQPNADVDALRGRVATLTHDFPLYDGLETW